MRVAARVIELCGPFCIPPGLHEYDGLRLYYSVRGQIQGHVYFWNNHKALFGQKFRYPADYGSWLLLYNAFFSPLGVPEIDKTILKNLLCARIGLDPATLDEEYQAVPTDLPDLTASIVLPTKDRPLDLARALEHLTRHQSRVPFEIIVVDNNPSSGLTAPVVARFVKVKYLVETRPGVGYARNTGTLAARGDIVISTDDDVVVTENWLDNLIAPFADARVGAVMGLVLPYELNTPAQGMFEKLGGLGLGYEYHRYDAAFFNGPELPDVSKLGNTSTAAFRFRDFADPKIGPFEVALGSGTPARGGGDVYQFYRVLAAGKVCVYEPKARVYHKHRSEMKQLRKQLINFESGYTAMLWRIGTRDKDKRAFRVLRYYVPKSKQQMLWRNLRRAEFRLFSLTLQRSFSNLIGPYNLWKALSQTRRLGDFSAADFAERLATREPLVPEKVQVQEREQVLCE